MADMPTQLTTDFNVVLDRADIDEALQLLAPPIARECAEMPLRRTSTRAASIFERAAEAGYPPAMYEFGVALFHGKTVAKDAPRAVSLARASA